jgi:hypothetical protein
MRIRTISFLLIIFLLLFSTTVSLIAHECVPACTGCKSCEAGVCVNNDDLCDDCESCVNGSCESDCTTGQCCENDVCVNDCSIGKCCDDGDCVSSCPTGKCCSDGTCVSSCPSGKCCKDGECETPSDWSTWSTTITVTMPDNVKNKIKSAIESIPNVDNINITEAKLSCTADKRDCCTDGGTLIEDGERYQECVFTLSASVDGIVIWGPPSFDETFEITGVLKADLKIKAGITLDGEGSVGATGGRRWDDCDEGCYYGSIDADFDIGVSLTLEIDACVKILWWETCGSIEFTPASVSVGITCGVRYNSKTACDGLHGDCCLKDIIFESKFKIGSDIGLTFKKTIYETEDC